jgi:Nif-specific regulatory protein
MQPRIAVISGPRLGGVFPLSPGDFLIGRDSAANLHLADEFVSLRHCIVTVNEDRYFIHDCGSLNGTTLNGERITGRQPLLHGHQFGVGSAQFIFLVEPDAATPDFPVLFDAAPMDPAAVPVSIDGNALHQTMVEFTRELRHLRRNPEMMRQKTLQFLFTKIPAERAAIVLAYSDDITDGLQFEMQGAIRPIRPIRESPQTSGQAAVRVNKAMAERVYREGISRMSPSVICIPLDGFDGRLGVILAETADRAAPFDHSHFELLAVIATVAGEALEHSARMERIEAEVSVLKRDMEMRSEIIGDSDAITKLGAQIARVAGTDSTVLIQGETGTGKELIARAVHQNSRRSAGPFVAINCGAITDSLFESELFGHEKGAFTGAIAQKKGKFELAGGGTLFLDEVGELPLPIQVKLLRVLQEREIERLGGTKPIKVNIRLIAATNRDLDAEVERKAFRHDLLFRLKVVTIVPPPLRNCGEDIVKLARHFVARFSREMVRNVRGISPEAEQLLRNFHWPGNVRQLQNFMDRAVVEGSTDMVLPEDLPEELMKAQSNPPIEASLKLDDVIDAAQRAAIQKAFAKAAGNCTEAAELLGRNRTGLYKVVKKLQMTI